MQPVKPIAPTDRPRNNVRRAVMAVRREDDKTVFTVINTETGERKDLPEIEAWKLHQELNIEV